MEIELCQTYQGWSDEHIDTSIHKRVTQRDITLSTKEQHRDLPKWALSRP